MKKLQGLWLLAFACGCQPAPVDSVDEALSSGGVDLIAIGSLSGTTGDRSAATADLLDNGAAGNLLGGLGSGLAYAGWGRFIAVPDRGPNAVTYNAAVDSTTSYINRFQAIRMDFAPGAAGAALPLTVTPVLEWTTLLWSWQPLTYGSGVGVDLGSGAPALNKKHRSYFTGRSDNFDPEGLSTDPHDGRLDPEGVRVSNDGFRVYITDEYGPYVYEFSRLTGERLRTFTLPDEFAVAHLSAGGDAEISGNTSGRVANKGMEGLAITPDGRTLIGAMQSPLIQDGGTNGRFTRIVTIDTWTGELHQHAYELTNIGTAAKPKYPTISEVVAINDHELLVDERDGKGRGDDSTAVYKKIYRIDLGGAAEVGGLAGEASLNGKAVAKTLFLDVVAALVAHGMSANDIPAKLEGLAFGPDVVIDGALQHTLFISNDNDFIGTVTDSHHPTGIDNPNQFFVFGVAPTALSGYVHQKLFTLF